MRIALDARYLRDEYSGIGVYSENLIEALARADSSHEYVVITHTSYRGTLEVGPNFTVISDHARPVSLRTVWTLQELLRKYEIELLHSLFPLCPLLWRGRLLVTVHDLQPLLDPAFTGGRILPLKMLYDAFYRFTYPSVLRKANYLVCDSFATKEYVRALFPDVANKVLVVHGGIGKDCFLPPDPADIERVREKYAIPDRFLFYIGSTRPNKNLPRMLDAFEEFIKRYPEHEDLCWVLVVKPDRFFDPFFASVRERGLLGRIQIHEQVSEADRRVFYHLATLLYFVTKFEGFGLPVLEAQAQGLPVLASTHGALPEIAGKAAILCDPDDVDSIVDGLARYFHDPALRDRMIAAGYENVKRFSWDKAAQEVLDMYNHLLS
ncbi:MAG: glycosyl transferase family 1 [Candidatus Sumerlaea sp.]|uniref:Glycosyltransferase n=1 Tax=Sumerlaea chitinivorans TaxID=2250252 RepID=A0A2Z4Y2U3_SUMC1|nr:Glycosyltransferase [Candidatus Sumerlaea chitinivorans]GIX45377.1 MAG: glycosyl transferase family 1 [Candidatus Sumerlaea sp.]